MNLHYLLSVIVGRASNLLVVVIFSYLLSAHSFGIYSLIATNAMLLYYALVGWIPSYAWREISQSDQLARPEILFRIVHLIGWAAAILISLAALALLSVPFNLTGLQMATTAIWAAAILGIDTILIAKNASGESRAYASLTIIRALLCLVLPVVLIRLGLDFWGGAFGQILAIILSLGISGAAIAIWREMRKPEPFHPEFLAPLRFGLSSVFALNIYMFTNAVSRNIISLDIGPEVAGYASLASDLFYAPVALFAMSISLSKTPELYRTSANGRELEQAANSEFLLSNLAVILPYMVGGAFVSAAIAKLTLGAGVEDQVAAIAALSVVLGGCFGLLGTITTIALTSGRVASAVLISFATVSAVAVAQLAVVSHNSLASHVQAMTAAISLVTLAALAGSRQLIGTSPPLGELAKILAATGTMAAALTALGRHDLPLSPIPEIAVGGAVFLLAAFALSCSSVLRLLRQNRSL